MFLYPVFAVNNRNSQEQPDEDGANQDVKPKIRNSKEKKPKKSVDSGIGESLDISDDAIIRLMMSQGKSENQAKSAVALLKLLQIGPLERHRILSDPDGVVHFICYFGSLMPFFMLVIAILVLIIAEIYDIFYDEEYLNSFD